MHANQFLDAGSGRLTVQQQVVQATCVEFVFDRVKPRRSFRMVVTPCDAGDNSGCVTKATGMGGSGCGDP